MLTDEQIAELQRLADAATPGPWVDYNDPDDPPCRMGGAWAGVTYPAKTRRNGIFLDWEPGASESAETAHYEWMMNERTVDAQSRADAAFIARSRTAVPDLIATVAKLRAEVAGRDRSLEYVGREIDDYMTRYGTALRERDDLRAKLAAAEAKQKKSSNEYWALYEENVELEKHRDGTLRDRIAAAEAERDIANERYDSVIVDVNDASARLASLRAKLAAAQADRDVAKKRWDEAEERVTEIAKDAFAEMQENARLRETVRDLLASAHPHPEEHPTMTKAWARAKAVLALGPPHIPVGARVSKGELRGLVIRDRDCPPGRVAVNWDTVGSTAHVDPRELVVETLAPAERKEDERDG